MYIYIYLVHMSCLYVNRLRTLEENPGQPTHKEDRIEHDKSCRWGALFLRTKLRIPPNPAGSFAAPLKIEYGAQHGIIIWHQPKTCTRGTHVFSAKIPKKKYLTTCSIKFVSFPLAFTHRHPNIKRRRSDWTPNNIPSKHRTWEAWGSEYWKTMVHDPAPKSVSLTAWFLFPKYSILENSHGGSIFVARKSQGALLSFWGALCPRRAA